MRSFRFEEHYRRNRWLLFARGGPAAVGEAFDLHASGAGVFVDPTGQCCRDGAGKLRPGAADGELNVAVAPCAGDRLVGAEVTGPQARYGAALANELHRAAETACIAEAVDGPG